jgi:hypothetical protein
LCILPDGLQKWKDIIYQSEIANKEYAWFRRLYGIDCTNTSACAGRIQQHSVNWVYSEYFGELKEIGCCHKTLISMRTRGTESNKKLVGFQIHFLHDWNEPNLISYRVPILAAGVKKFLISVSRFWQNIMLLGLYYSWHKDQ